MIYRFIQVSTLTIVLLSSLGLLEAEELDSCSQIAALSLLQHGAPIGGNSRLIIKDDSNSKYPETCNDTLPVRGSTLGIPSRGFIACCGEPFIQPPGVVLKVASDFLNAGGRLIDTAPDYGSAQEVGQAVRSVNVPRSEIWITTKVDTDSFDPFGTDPPFQWTLQQVQEQMTTMELAYLDVVTLHFGPAQVSLQSSGRNLSKADHLQMWMGLIEAKKKGWVRHIGVCEHSRSEIEHLISGSNEVPAIALTWYSIWMPAEQEQYIEWLQSQTITVVAYGVFQWKSQGSLASKRVAVTSEVASKYNVTYGQLAEKIVLDKGVGIITPFWQEQYMWEDLPCLDFHVSFEDIAGLYTQDVPRLSCSWFTSSGQYLGCCIP